MPPKGYLLAVGLLLPVAGAVADTAPPADRATTDEAPAAAITRGESAPLPTFARVDADGDGYLSAEEVHGAIRISEQTLQQADADRNGRLDAREYQDALRMAMTGGSDTQGSSFERLDADADGYLTPQEVPTDGELAANWLQADRNGDGHIDQAELAAFETEQGRTRPSSQGPSGPPDRGDD